MKCFICGDEGMDSSLPDDEVFYCAACQDEIDDWANARKISQRKDTKRYYQDANDDARDMDLIGRGLK